MEPGVQSQVDELVTRLEELQGSGRIVNLLDVFACLTGDTIGQYAFPRPYGFLDGPDSPFYWHTLMMEVSQNGHMLSQFGWMMPHMKSMPDRLVKVFQSQMATLLDFQVQSRSQVMEVKQQIAEGKKPPGQIAILGTFTQTLKFGPKKRKEITDTMKLRPLPALVQ